jgi:hypothetical protein
MLHYSCDCSFESRVNEAPRVSHALKQDPRFHAFTFHTFHTSHSHPTKTLLLTSYSSRPERRDAPHSSPATWSRRRPTRGGPYATPAHHLDAILDLKAIEFPQPMLASASRDGVIKVWA